MSALRWLRPVRTGGGTSANGRGRVKTRRNFVNDRAEQDFSDFFDSERSKASQKRTKRARAKTRGSFTQFRSRVRVAGTTPRGHVWTHPAASHHPSELDLLRQRQGAQAIRDFTQAMRSDVGNTPPPARRLPGLFCADRPQWRGGARADHGALRRRTDVAGLAF
jgi:hypothetical protein